MKIAINCSYFVPSGGGIKEYIFNLTQNLSKYDQINDYILYVAPDYFEFALEELPNEMLIKKTKFSSREKIQRGLFERKYWLEEEKNEKFDLFHSPFFHCPSFVKAKIVITVHDLRFKQYPSTYSRLRFLYLLFAVKKAVIRADKIISISKFTKQQIMKYYKIDEKKIKVIHESVNSSAFYNFSSEKQKDINGYKVVKNKFLLAVGHLEPRKNYERLIHAYNKLPISHKEKYSLLIVGKKEYSYLSTLRLIKSSSNVIYLNFVTREELCWLYANCVVHIFPSIYEGFGFPSLEAGLYKKATLGSKTSSIPEVTGEGGSYFDPFSIQDISDKINDFLSDCAKQKKLASDAFNNVSRFSWKKNAIETVSVYKSVSCSK